MVDILIVCGLFILVGYFLMDSGQSTYTDVNDPEEARRDANRLKAKKWLKENPLPHRSRSPSSPKQHFSENHTGSGSRSDPNDTPTY